MGIKARQPLPRDAIIPTKLQRERKELRDPRTRKGELLWPERFGPKELAELKAAARAFGSSGQLQQRPAPSEGTLFLAKHFRRYKEEIVADGIQFVLGTEEPNKPPPYRCLASQCQWFQTIDTAMTANDESAYTVVMTFCITPNGKLLVYHVWRERVLIPDQLNIILMLRQGPIYWNLSGNGWANTGRTWPGRLFLQAIEPKASGLGIIQAAELKGVYFKKLKAQDSKEARAQHATIMYQEGGIWHPEEAEWLVDFEDELLSFPNGATVDQCDCVAHSAMVVAELGIMNQLQQTDLVCWPNKEGDKKEETGEKNEDDNFLTTFMKKRKEARQQALEMPEDEQQWWAL